MTRIEILRAQTEDAYNWVDRLVDSVPFESWDETPEVLETNLSWQVGHLMMSFNYHTVIVQIGLQKEVFSVIPLKEYAAMYTWSPAKDSEGKVDPKTLREQLTYMQKKSLEVMETITEDMLDQPLEASNMPHPVAKTKYQALDWNVKHTMWHCGQMASLLRILGHAPKYGF